MSLFSTFALGAAQGAAQGFVQGTVNRIQSEMEEAKAKIQDDRARTMLKLQQEFTAAQNKEQREFTESRDTARFEQQNEIEASRNARALADNELKERLANARNEKDREIAEMRHKQTLAALSAREGKSKGTYDTAADGTRIYMEGATAQPVKYGDGSSVKTLKNMSESDKAAASSIERDIAAKEKLLSNTPMGKTGEATRSRLNVELQDLRRKRAAASGQSAAAASGGTDNIKTLIRSAMGG